MLTGPILVAELCVATEPLQPSEPLPPLAAHEVAPVVDQVAVTDCPVCIALGVTEKVLMTGGGGVLLTSTVTDTGVLAPPSPVHVSVYTKFPAALIGPTNSVDTGATAPLQLSAPLPPLAEQEVAPIDAQVSSVEPPVGIVLGNAVSSVMSGGTGGTLLTLRTTELGALGPPGPVQFNV